MSGPSDERLREIAEVANVTVTFDVVRDIASELLALRERVAKLERVRLLVAPLVPQLDAVARSNAPAFLRGITMTATQAIQLASAMREAADA